MRTLTVAVLVLLPLAACRCEDDLSPIPTAQRTTCGVDDADCRRPPEGADTGSIEGRICNRHTGALVTQAEVYVLAADAIVMTTTDDDGRFLLTGVPTGEVVLTARGAGFQRSFLVAVLAGQTTQLDVGEDCRAGTAEEGSVFGRFCDATPAGVLVGAQVLIVGTADSGNDVTDTDGAFFYGPLRAGTYQVDVLRGDAVLFHIADVRVVAGETTTVTDPQSCAGTLPPPVEPADPVDPAFEGNVEGALCAPDGETNLTNATVYIVRPDGSRASTTTDDQGRFILQGAPAGPQVLHIEKGSFSTTIDVLVPANGTLTIPPEECSVPLAGARIAVVTGAWDDVGTVLLDVGIDPTTITTFVGDDPYDPWHAALLEDDAMLAQFDIVFINCGAELQDFEDSPTAIANLQAFVDEGGSLYVSDLAYDLVEIAFPTFIDFYGNDAQRGAANEGEVQDALIGTVIDTGLAASLGTSTVELHYPYGFAVMQSVASSVQVYIKGDAPLWTGGSLNDVPHIVGFPSGAGRVIYTSFHQEPGIHPQMESVLHLLMFEL